MAIRYVIICPMKVFTSVKNLAEMVFRSENFQVSILIIKNIIIITIIMIIIIIIIIIITSIIIIITRPWPVFGRQGLVGSSGGYTYHGYTSYASPRACGSLGSVEKWLEMEETQFLLFIGASEKCLEMGKTQFLLFIGTFEKCLEMGET